MLTVSETQKIAEDYLEMIKGLHDLPSEDRNRALCLQLGIPHDIYGSLVDDLVEKYLGVPSEILMVFAPNSLSAIGASLSLGIIIGKKLESLTHVCPGETRYASERGPDGPSHE